ncbi:MAG: hypothetical protein R3C03_07560 [Pirellulaceae bacterium]
MNKHRFEHGELAAAIPLPRGHSDASTNNIDAMPGHAPVNLIASDLPAIESDDGELKLVPLDEPTTPTDSGVATMLPAIELEDVEDGWTRGLRATQRFVPGWVVSFVCHVILLVSLALYGLAGQGADAITLSSAVSDTPEVDVLKEVDLSLPSVSTMEASSQLDKMFEVTELDLSSEIESTSVEMNEAQLSASQLSAIGLAMGGGAAKEGAAPPKVEAKDGAKADFFGVSARGSNFVYVIDCSGSMAGPRWERTKYELYNSLEKLGPERTFLVLLYNSETWAMFNTRPEDTVLVKATPENVVKLKRWMEQQMPGFSTYPKFALASALSVTPDSIFLLSDGEFYDDTVEYLRQANAPRDRGDGKMVRVPIHTISLDFTAGLLTLKMIADENDGAFRMVNPF